MPDALVIDEIVLRKMMTSVAAVMICKLLTHKVVLRFPLSMLWGNTLYVCVNMTQNEYPSIIGKEQQWYPLHRLNPVSCHLLEIQATPSIRYPVLTSALEPIVMVTMPGVAEIINSVIYEMSYRTDYKPLNLLNTESVKLTHKDQNTCIDKPENG